MVMNWFGMNEGENDISLATHRQNGDTGATYLTGMEEVFTYMNDTYDQDWIWFTNQDLDDPHGEESYIGDYCLQAGTTRGLVRTHSLSAGKRHPDDDRLG